MPTLFVFLLKVNIALLLFCAGYYLVLRHLTFYSLNRAYLVTAIIFSTIYPKIDLTAFAQRHEDIAVPIQNVLLNWQEPAVKLVRPLTQPNYWQWATLLFWAGAALLAIRLIIQLYSLCKLYRSSKPATILDHDVRLMSGQAAPFSFWRSIYVNPDNHTDTDLKAILLHEQAHVNGLHTIDILLAELSSIFYWFNPGVWLMKKAVRENIEFITDRKILNKGIDTKTYQYSLINVSFNTTTPGIVNHFNISTIKKRIIMMNAKRSSRVNLTRYAFVMPAVALLLIFSFSNAAIVKKSGSAYTAIKHDITIQLIEALPASLVSNVKARIAETKTIFAPGTVNEEGNTDMIYYINGIKTSETDGQIFPEDTESIYFLNSTDAKKYFDAGDGKHKVAFANTTNSIEGKATKEKIEKLMGSNKISAEVLHPGIAKKISTQTTTAWHHINADTNKTQILITANNLKLLDSLNYVLNGKKISSADFKKLDPNSIMSVNIMSATDAKLLLKDLDLADIKNNGKILFVTTNDSDEGKKLAGLLGVRNRISNVRIAVKPAGLGVLNEVIVDTLAFNGPGGMPAKITTLPGGTQVAGLNKGNGTVYTSTDVLKLNKLSGTTVYTYKTPAPADLAKLNKVKVFTRSKAPQLFETTTLTGDAFYSNTGINRISDKLIVIDGKEATESDLKKLSAFDIDRMNTSSSADTVKKYGSKAKYGVVFIYTKKGK